MADTYSASARNRRIMFQRAIVTGGELGGEKQDWTDYTGAWACVRFGTGSERRGAAQESASAPATFYVLRTGRTADLSVTDRIKFDGGIWDIANVVPSLDRNVGMEVTAVRALE